MSIFCQKPSFFLNQYAQTDILTFMGGNDLGRSRIVSDFLAAECFLLHEQAFQQKTQEALKTNFSKFPHFCFWSVLLMRKVDFVSFPPRKTTKCSTCSGIRVGNTRKTFISTKKVRTRIEIPLHFINGLINSTEPTYGHLCLLFGHRWDTLGCKLFGISSMAFD